MGRHPILRCAAGTAASLLLAPYLAAQATFRVSVSSTGDSGDAFSGFPALSSNGRLVAFSSSASNLAAAPQSSQVLVHDRASGVTSLASVGAADGSVNFNPTLSGDGRRVAFESSVSIFGSNYRSLLLHEHLTGTTTQVYGSLGAPSFEPDLSADGLALAFVTPDALVPSDTNELGDIYVYHVQTGAFERVSVPAGGGEADA